MNNASLQPDSYFRHDLCAMCGARENDKWETRPTRPKRLNRSVRPGDPGITWTLCDECSEGLAAR